MLKNLLIRPAFADDQNITINAYEAGIRIGSLADLIRIIIQMVLIIAGIMVFGFMLFGGIQYISSGGDKLQAQQARDKITYAIIGLIIIVGAYAIAKVMEVAFGINIFNITVKGPKNDWANL